MHQKGEIVETSSLNAVVRKLTERGILAADESDGTIKKRLEAAGIAPVPENILAWRRFHDD